MRRFWEKLLKSHKDVAISAEYLPNLLRTAIDALETHLSQNNERELRGETQHHADVAIRILRNALGTDPVIALLRWDEPEDVEQLERLLAEETVDALCLLKTLHMLQESLSEDLVQRAIVGQLGSGEEADSEVLRGAAVVLACQNIGRFAKSQMKKLLNRSFARAVSLTLLNEHAEHLCQDPDIAEELRALEVRVVQETVARGDTMEVGAREELQTGRVDLFNAFGGERGWRSAYRLLALISRLWSAELYTNAQEKGEQQGGLASAIASLQADREVQRAMARQIIVRYAEYGFRERFKAVVKGQEGETDPILGEAASSLERTLAHFGISTWPERYEERPEAFPPITTRSAFALAGALPIVLSEVCAENYASANEELVRRVSERLGERLTELLADELRRSELSDGNEAEALCTSWVARRQLHSEAVRILAELNSSLDEHLQSFSRETAIIHTTTAERFWSLWRRHYVSEAFLTLTSSTIPWEAIEDTHMLERIVAEALTRFGGALEDYLVVLQVEGIRPEGMNWSMADVTFYDPEYFDYGEGYI